MVGIILTEDELQTIFDILGLNEDQGLVYMTLLSVGTLGENMSTGLEEKSIDISHENPF